MLIQPAKFKKIKKLVNVRVSDEAHGCDECGKVIDLNKIDVEYLEVSVFNNNTYTTETEHPIFCSWKCVLKYLPKVKSNYFVSLPYLHYDRKGETSVKALFKELKSVLPTNE